METPFQKARNKAISSMEAIGMAGSFVGLDEKGRVVVNILSAEQLLQLMQLYDDPKDIPSEYTIYDEEGSRLTQK